MADYQITINVDNAAFDPHMHREAARILRELADRIDDDGAGIPEEPINLRDINGNKVGEAKWL